LVLEPFQIISTNFRKGRPWEFFPKINWDGTKNLAHAESSWFWPSKNSPPPDFSRLKNILRQRAESFLGKIFPAGVALHKVGAKWIKPLFW
jgi:hypothetical protein